MDQYYLRMRIGNICNCMLIIDFLGSEEVTRGWILFLSLSSNVDNANMQLNKEITLIIGIIILFLLVFNSLGLWCGKWAIFLCAIYSPSNFFFFFFELFCCCLGRFFVFLNSKTIWSFFVFFNNFFIMSGNKIAITSISSYMD